MVPTSPCLLYHICPSWFTLRTIPYLLLSKTQSGKLRFLTRAACLSPSYDYFELQCPSFCQLRLEIDVACTQSDLGVYANAMRIVYLFVGLMIHQSGVAGGLLLEFFCWQNKYYLQLQFSVVRGTIELKRREENACRCHTTNNDGSVESFKKSYREKQ